MEQKLKINTEYRVKMQKTKGKKRAISEFLLEAKIDWG